MSRRWIIVIVLSLLGLISGAVCVWMVHEMNRIPQGFSAAPNPSVWGMIQVGIAALSTLGFTGGGVLTAILNLWQTANPTPPSPVPGPNPGTKNKKAEIIADLIVAFPSYIADVGNQAKAMRFWFDLIQLGIELDPDDETKVWLLNGADIMRRRFFPIPANLAVTIVSVSPSVDTSEAV